ncbi:MAG: hypothetical protein WBE58_09075 [Verrucomicrobiales bacterium]
MLSKVLQSPLTHHLQVSAGRLLKIWLVFAALAGAGGFGLMGLRAAGIIPPGETPLPLFILAVLFVLVAGFCFIQGARARSEFALMRQGDYLARWIYPAEDFDLVRADAGSDRDQKVKMLFHIPFWAISLIGIGLGIVGAFAKSDPMLALKVGSCAFGIAVVAGLAVAIPAHFLTGVSQQIARHLAPEAIFASSGIYTPGRFLPIMDFILTRREVTVVPGPANRTWLHVRVQQGTQQITGMPNSTMGAVFQILVPVGKEEEAKELATYYSS